MKIRLFDSYLSVVWQSALAVCLGVCAGMLLFTFTGNKQASALTKTGLTSIMSWGQDQNGLSAPTILPKLEEKKYILLLGVDSNGKDSDRFSGTRSDTMMLVSIDPIFHKVGVVSIPRDSRVHISNHGIDKINAAHALGGPALTMQTVKESFGVPIDNFIEVDTHGLKQLFEILGPVEVLVEKEMHYVDHTAKLNVDLKPGLQTLTPAQAEEYVRFRHDAKGDIGRIERQQWFLRQSGKKLKEPQIILKLPALVGLAYHCIRTDLSMQDVLKLAAFAKDFPPDKALTAMLPGEPRMISGCSYWVPNALSGQALLNRVLGCSTTGFYQDTPSSPEITLAEDESVTADASAPGLTFSDKPLSIAIKYPKSCDQLSLALEKQLTKAGFRVRYRWQMPDSECQHEQITQQSVRANEERTEEMFKAVPEIQSYPISIAIEQRPAVDMVISLTPHSQIASVYSPTIEAPPAHSQAALVPQN